jgi:hypothetical protein
MKQKKHDLIPFSFYDLTGIARHLEKQAARGWMIEKISNFGWRYRAIPPQKLHFTATYYPPASDFEPEPSDGELTFQDFCLHSGWKFAGSNGPLQVFYTDQPDCPERFAFRLLYADYFSVRNLRSPGNRSL